MLVTFSSPRAALATAPQPGDGQNNVLVSGESAGNPAVLDAHRRLALGMIETGNRDDEIGGAGGSEPIPNHALGLASIQPVRQLPESGRFTDGGAAALGQTLRGFHP